MKRFVFWLRASLLLRGVGKFDVTFLSLRFTLHFLRDGESWLTFASGQRTQGEIWEKLLAMHGNRSRVTIRQQ